MSEREESPDVPIHSTGDSNKDQSTISKPTPTDPASLVCQQTEFHLEGKIMATTGIKFFPAKVYFGLLLAVGSHLIKLNFWGNLAKLWSKKLIVGWDLKVTNGFVITANENFRVTKLKVEVSINQGSAIKFSPYQEKPSFPLTSFDNLISESELLGTLVHTEGNVVEIKSTEKQVRVKLVGGEDDLEIITIFTLDRFDKTIQLNSTLTIFFGKLCQLGPDHAIKVIDFTRCTCHPEVSSPNCSKKMELD